MNKTITTILLASTIWSCGGSSSASPCNGKECAVGVKLVHIQNERAFEFIEAEEIVRLAIEFLNANTTLDLVYKGGESIADPFPGTATLENFRGSKERFVKLRTYLDKNNIGGNAKNRELTVVIDQPLVDNNGIIYTAGRANICSLYQNSLIGITYATPFTNNYPSAGSYGRSKEEMLIRSANTTAHEIGHQLGALHKDCEDDLCIMRSSRTKFIHDGLNGLFYVFSESNNEMEVCTRRETRRKVLTCRTKLNRRRCKKRARIRNIRLRDVRFRENHNRSLGHTCNLLED